MEPVKLGRIIAERTLRMKRPGQPDKQVIVRIGMPQRFGPEDYRCPFQIKGRDKDKVRSIIGTDGIDVILQTLKLIGKIMGDYPRADGSKFSWLNDRHCGFPIIYWRRTPKERHEMKKMRKWMREPMRKWFREQKKLDPEKHQGQS